MTDLQKYLAEEVAEDHHDGIITRREAMRRLGLLGVTASVASTMLSAPAVAKPAASRTRDGSHHPQGTVEEWAPIATEPITFPGVRGELMGAWAAAAEPRGGVLVIHENRGLTDHIRMVASRLAANGYSALALDLLSEEGGTVSFPDEVAVTVALNTAADTPERFDSDMQSAVTEIQRRLPGKRTAAIGFCFGGGMVWRLLASGERRLSAAAPFYGPFPPGGAIADSRLAVLGVYAGLDDRVNATRDAAKAALEAAAAKHLILTFSAANHAFFNDTNPERFNPPAAAEAYRRVIEWFDRYVDKDRRGHHGHDED